VVQFSFGARAKARQRRAADSRTALRRGSRDPEVARAVPISPIWLRRPIVRSRLAGAPQNPVPKAELLCEPAALRIDILLSFDEVREGPEQKYHIAGDIIAPPF